jgi:hypothetical protein
MRYIIAMACLVHSKSLTCNGHAVEQSVTNVLFAFTVSVGSVSQETVYIRRIGSGVVVLADRAVT